jgi:hypothetical protein
MTPPPPSAHRVLGGVVGVVLAGDLQNLARPRSNTGQILVKHRSKVADLQYRSDAGQMLVKTGQYWSNTSRVSCSSCGSPKLERHRSNTGQTPVKHWSNTGRILAGTYSRGRMSAPASAHLYAKKTSTPTPRRQIRSKSGVNQV